MDVYGCIWMYMDVYGCIWMYMDVYGCIWTYMDVCRYQSSINWALECSSRSSIPGMILTSPARAEDCDAQRKHGRGTAHHILAIREYRLLNVFQRIFCIILCWLGSANCNCCRESERDRENIHIALIDLKIKQILHWFHQGFPKVLVCVWVRSLVGGTFSFPQAKNIKRRHELQAFRHL